jgi:hypothetical protein
VNVIQAALFNLDRKAGADRSADILRIVRCTIAGSSLTALQRTTLLSQLEKELLDAGLT